MSNVIFARPRWDYGSYVDLYRLIELSGYPLIFFDEIQPQSDNVYIMTMFNGENQNGWPEVKARIILWDLEWRLEGDYPRIPGVSEIWASDAWYAGKIGARYVPLGSHLGLNLNPDEQAGKMWDYAMLSYMSYRREWLVNQLMGVSLAPRGWGQERHDVLIRTRAMLHVHQHDFAATVAPQRWAIAAAYRLPVVSECVSDPGIFTPTYALWSEYQYLPIFAHMWKDDRRLVDYGLALHELLCVQHTFGKCVEAAL